MNVKKMPVIVIGGVLLLLIILTLSCMCLGGKEGFGLGKDDDGDIDEFSALYNNEDGSDLYKDIIGPKLKGLGNTISQAFTTGAASARAFNIALAGIVKSLTLSLTKDFNNFVRFAIRANL